MTSLDDRRRALEDKYILDLERSLKVRARRNRLLAEWVAAAIGRNDLEAYVDEVVATALASPEDQDLLRKIVVDFNAAGQAADEAFIREKMHDLMYTAAEAMESEAATPS
ncbi:ATPase inhibitor subunit zeta [Rhizobium sullae]|uniref:ATPase inhibitor subunit zeta n=1 Tax=Rhizobium sullae TaxID=50338 RepID=UPI000B350AFE|nr:ATPase inhibitor subunit zeta [Rhizobium sullae]